jgi:hypothetical protein
MYTIFWLKKPEGTRPLERTIFRWVDNIKMDVRGIGLKVVNWMH